MNLEITNKGNPTEDFRKIAEHLMNECILIVGNGYYRFTELEFYYSNKVDKHESKFLHRDVYSHEHVNQTENGRWYFHGSGLDITFGSGADIFGGILIRGIKNLDDSLISGIFINGPINCVQELFKNLGAVSSPQNMSFYIQELPWNDLKPFTEETEVFGCKRVGINPIKDQPDLRFHSAFYRFLIYPRQKHADKTNIAFDLKEHISKSTNLKLNEEEITALLGSNFFKSLPK